MNLRLKDFWQNRSYEPDEHATLSDPISKTAEETDFPTKHGCPVYRFEINCRIAIDEFDVWS